MLKKGLLFGDDEFLDHIFPLKIRVIRTGWELMAGMHLSMPGEQCDCSAQPYEQQLCEETVDFVIPTLSGQHLAGIIEIYRSAVRLWPIPPSETQ